MNITRPLLQQLGVLILGILATWGGLALGWWYSPLIVAVLWTLWVSAWWRQYAGAVLIALFGTVLPLTVESLHENVIGAATVTAAMMGYTHQGYLVFMLTLGFAILLSLSGAFLGHAVRNLMWGSAKDETRSSPHSVS